MKSILSLEMDANNSSINSGNNYNYSRNYHNNNNTSSSNNNNNGAYSGLPNHFIEERQDVIFRKVRGILNKITPETFDKLSKELVNVGLDSPRTLRGLIYLLFDKALKDLKYSSLYAKLCQELSEKAPNFETEPGPNTFCKFLISKCEDEFEKRRKATEDFDCKNELTDEEYEQRAIVKQKMLGNIKFICELGKKQLLQEEILHECIRGLLSKKKERPIQDQAPDLECLCQIMRTIGSLLDVNASKNLMNQYFERIDMFSKKPELPSRIRFMLKDVIDLRNNNWRPRPFQRVEDNVPQTLSRIRESAGLDSGSGSAIDKFGNSRNLLNLGDLSKLHGDKLSMLLDDEPSFTTSTDFHWGPSFMPIEQHFDAFSSKHEPKKEVKKYIPPTSNLNPSTANPHSQSLASANTSKGSTANAISDSQQQLKRLDEQTHFYDSRHMKPVQRRNSRDFPPRFDEEPSGFHQRGYNSQFGPHRNEPHRNEFHRNEPQRNELHRNDLHRNELPFQPPNQPLTNNINRSGRMRDPFQPSRDTNVSPVRTALERSNLNTDQETSFRPRPYQSRPHAPGFGSIQPQSHQQPPHLNPRTNQHYSPPIQSNPAQPPMHRYPRNNYGDFPDRREYQPPRRYNPPPSYDHERQHFSRHFNDRPSGPPQAFPFNHEPKREVKKYIPPTANIDPPSLNPHPQPLATTNTSKVTTANSISESQRQSDRLDEKTHSYDSRPIRPDFRRNSKDFPPKFDEEPAGFGHQRGFGGPAGPYRSELPFQPPNLPPTNNVNRPGRMRDPFQPSRDTNVSPVRTAPERNNLNTDQETGFRPVGPRPFQSRQSGPGFGPIQSHQQSHPQSHQQAPLSSTRTNQHYSPPNQSNQAQQQQQQQPMHRYPRNNHGEFADRRDYQPPRRYNPPQNHHDLERQHFSRHFNDRANEPHQTATQPTGSSMMPPIVPKPPTKISETNLSLRPSHNLVGCTIRSAGNSSQTTGSQLKGDHSSGDLSNNPDGARSQSEHDRNLGQDKRDSRSSLDSDSKNVASGDAASKSEALEQNVNKFMAVLNDKTEGLSSSNLNRLASKIRELKIPKNCQCECLSNALQYSIPRSENDRESVAKLFVHLVPSIFEAASLMNAFKSIFEQMHSLEVETPRVKSFVAGFVSQAIADNILSIEDLGSILVGGKHYPLFLLVLQKLEKNPGQAWLNEKFIASKVNLIDMLPEVERKKERLASILKDRGLSFLDPMLTIEPDLWDQMRACDASPTGVYRWVKDNIDQSIQATPTFAHVLISCLLKYIHHCSSEKVKSSGSSPTASPSNSQTVSDLEKELLQKYQQVLQAMIKDKQMQLATLYAVQLFYYKLDFPKGSLLRWFHMLYDLNIVDDDVYFVWKEEVTDEYPGKGQALFQVNTWLNWLAEAEDEEDEEEE